MRRIKRGSATSFFVAILILLTIVLIKKEFFLENTGYDFSGFVLPLFILLATVILARVAKQISHAYFDRASKKMRVFDRTKYALFGKLVSVIIWIIGLGVLISTVPQLRAASLSLFAGAGVLAVIIGFAMQKTFGNLASGVFIATFQPYRIGDRLKLIGEYGTVTDINLRHTVIETWDNRRIIIPNSRMDDEVIDNYTIGDPAILGTLNLGISYDSDMDRARSIIEEETRMHPDFFDYDKQKDLLASDESISIRAVEMTDSAIVLRLYFWAYDQPTYLKMRADLLEKIKKRFDKEGVEIPYSYHTLVYKKDLKKPKKTARKKAKK